MGMLDIYVSSVSALLSGVLAMILFVFQMLRQDQSLSLTSTRPFTDWNQLSQVFTNATGFIRTPNSGMVNLVVFKGQNPTAPPPALLQSLLDTAWCTSPTPRLDVTPSNRTPGCACITQTYLNFLGEFVLTNTTYATTPAYANMTTTKAANSTTAAAASTNTTNATSSARGSSDILSRYSSQVVGCLSSGAVWVVEPCGDSCFVDMISIILYSNAVVFLFSAAYLMARLHGEWGGAFALDSRYFYAKIVVGGLGAVMMFLVLFPSPVAHLLSGIGILYTTYTLIYSLHDELDFPRREMEKIEKEREQQQELSLDVIPYDPALPHPLLACLWSQVPAILPALTVYMAVTNVMRDYMGVFAFCVLGLVLGMCIQRLFWCFWYIPPALRGLFCFVNRLCFGIMLTFLVVASTYFFFQNSPFVSSAASVWLLFVVVVWLTGGEWLNQNVHEKDSGDMRWEEVSYFVCILGCNFVLAVISVVDSYA